jgi:hypothetical protein
MKKTLAILLSAVMMIVMLTGCIHQDMGVKMNKDGTGSITTTLGIEKDFYDQLVSMGSDPFEGKTTTEYEYDGTTYVSYAESKEYSSYEEMEQALLDMTYETELIEDAQEDTSDDGEVDGVIDVAVDTEEAPAQDNHIFSSVSIEKDSGIFQSTYSFHAVLNAQSNGNADYDMNDTFKVTLSVEMPCEITDAKGGTAEGNKIIFDIADITESQELSATCEENHTGAVIGITLAVVALVVGLVFFFKSRK